MPALTMRGRYVMREYWSDSDLFLRLSAAEREVYVGLWMLADDAGWMPRDVPAIAAALYRYVDRAPREAEVASAIAHLRKLGKLESRGCCLYLPAVARYPRAGKKSTEHQAEHQSHSNGSDSKRQPRSKGFDPIRTDSNPSPDVSLPIPTLPDAREDENEGETEFQRLVPRAVALGGGEP